MTKTRNLNTTPSASAIRLAISTSFPGETNPLAGHIVFLMSDRFDNALRKSGGPIPANITPGKALQAHVANCVGTRHCPAITPVFATGKDSTGVLGWDLPANLQPGNNNVTLEDSNAEVLH